MSHQSGYTSPNAPQQQNQYGQAPEQQLPPPPPQEPKKSWFARHKILTGIGAVIALIVVVNVFSGGGDDDAPAAAESSAATEDASNETNEASGTEDDGAEDGEAADAENAAADEGEEQEEASEPEEAEADGFAVGDVAQDGKFEFVVTEVETGVEQVGSEYFNETAQGQFVLVHLEVTNVGDKAQTLLDSSQHLIDTDGREHSADSSAGIYIEDNRVLLNEINPGNTLSGVLVFDIPADATPASVELHDSMFSGGVSVSLE